MSKSAFYASKESLRKTREAEFGELLALRKFVLDFLEVKINDNEEALKFMNLRGRAYGLIEMYGQDWKD